VKLSAVLITQDAGAHLDACLAALSFADEIVVRDHGSTDGTLELCARHGARVIAAEWDGFGAAKAAVVAAARNRWVLSVDADEVVSPELRAAITALPDEPAAAAFAVNRLSRFLGRWIRHCGWHPEWIPRLFDRERAGFDERPVHEAVRTDGPVERLDGLLLHYAYDDLGQFVAKQDRYATLGAEAARAAGRRASVFEALLRGKWTFLRTYVLQGGLLDGPHGLLLCWLMGGATFLKYVKLWLLWREEKPAGEMDP
jgi:glycosyltransferase involved in cell wall biosynthesis